MTATYDFETARNMDLKKGQKMCEEIARELVGILNNGGPEARALSDALMRATDNPFTPAALRTAIAMIDGKYDAPQ